MVKCSLHAHSSMALSEAIVFTISAPTRVKCFAPNQTRGMQ